MRILEYVFEVTMFRPQLRQVHRTFAKLEEAVGALSDLPSANAVVCVAALGGNVDYGNFYLFLNEKGDAHVRLHEHREFLATEPSSSGVSGGEIEFLAEDGSTFTVHAAMTTSAARGKAALEYWLPNQGQWPELKWQ